MHTCSQEPDLLYFAWVKDWCDIQILLIRKADGDSEESFPFKVTTTQLNFCIWSSILPKTLMKLCRIFEKKKLLVSNFTIEHKLKVPKTLKGDIKTNIKHKKKTLQVTLALKKLSISHFWYLEPAPSWEWIHDKVVRGGWRKLGVVRAPLTSGRQLWILEKNYLFHKRLGDCVKQNLKICSTSCQRLLITSGSVYYQVHINITHNLSSRLQEEAYLRIPESGRA